MELNKKLDPKLGNEIHHYLKEKRVESPFLINNSEHDSLAKISAIAKHFSEIMNILGLDLKNDSLADTPKRVGKMYINEIFWGMQPENFPSCILIDNHMNYDAMVVVKDISLMSICEHHFVPIDGKAHVAYIPKNKVIGLSKINRIVDYFSKRPQVQERLTEQIYYALNYILGVPDVAVIIEATHFCVKMRGAKDQNSITKTARLGGHFRNTTETRQELMTHLNRS